MAISKGTVLITGANGGLGSSFVSRFLQSPQALLYSGLFAVRNPSSASALQGILAASAPESHNQHHEIISLDLSTLASVREGAKAINDRVASGALPPIRALVLNAAIQHHKGLTFTNDGLESNFAVNYLSNFLLMFLLLQSMDKDSGRIVIVSSWTHDPLDTRSGHIKEESHKVIFADVETLARPPIEDKENAGQWDLWSAGMRRYGMSKTLVVMFMFELQRRLSADPELSNISFVALDPGGMGTAIARDGPFLLQVLLTWIMPLLCPIFVYFQPNGTLRTPAKSAGDLMRASFDEETWGLHPQALYLNGSEVGHVTAEAKDETKQQRLWEGSLKYAGIIDGDTTLKNWQ